MIRDNRNENYLLYTSALEVLFHMVEINNLVACANKKYFCFLQ